MSSENTDDSVPTVPPCEDYLADVVESPGGVR